MNSSQQWNEKHKNNKPLYVELVSDCFLTSKEHFFSYTMARTRYILLNDVLFVLDQYTYTQLYSSLQCKLTEKIVHAQICCSIRTHYHDSEQSSLYSFSLMLPTQWRNNKDQFYSLLVDPTGARTHNLPRIRRHRCCSKDDSFDYERQARWDMQQLLCNVPITITSNKLLVFMDF